jgi:hypothetical protein
MRPRLQFVLAATLGLCLVAPAASAKVYFPMRDHVLVVGKPVRLAVPGCAAVGVGCIASYPGPVRIYLVRAEVPVPLRGADAAKPPRPARALGRLADSGELRFTPRSAGPFRLVALATIAVDGTLRTMRMPVSSVFVVHPRGWGEIECTNLTPPCTARQ